VLPNDEKLIAQLTSRRKLYDSNTRDPAKVKAHLVELQQAVWEECDRIEQQLA
jgi:hypothetical protein